MINDSWENEYDTIRRLKKLIDEEHMLENQLNSVRYEMEKIRNGKTKDSNEKTKTTICN